MTIPDIHTHISDDALPALVSYCQALGDTQFTLIADPNTYAALGERAESALKAGGVKLKTIVLQGDEIIADGRDQLWRVWPNWVGENGAGCRQQPPAG